MEYRYTITGNGLFVPEYKKQDGDWHKFYAKDMSGNMLKLCRSLAELSAPRKWGGGQWYFEGSARSDYEGAVFFTTELIVMAFLGAAQHWYSEFRTVNVNNILHP